MTDFTLLETEDAIRHLEMRDAMDSQSRIERIFNPTRIARIPIFRDGTVDGTGLVALRQHSYRTLNDFWPRAMLRLQWVSLIVAIVCAPLSLLWWWPLWTGTVLGGLVAITASLARKKEPVEARGSRRVTS